MAIKNKSNNKEIKDVKKDFLFEDEDEYLNKRSHIFNKKKNIGEKDSKKRINASLNEDLFFE